LALDPVTRKLILYVSAADPNVSAAYSVPALWLAKHGYRVLFLGHGDPGSKEIVTPYCRMPAAFVRLGGLAGLLRLLIAMLKLRFRQDLDIIYLVHGCVPAVAACFALAGVPRSRLIYYNSEFLEPGRHPMFEFFERTFARRAGSVICNELERARRMCKQYRLPETPTVMRTSLPAEWPLPSFDPLRRGRILKMAGVEDSPTARVVMAGGGFSHVRCSEELVQAFGLLPSSYVLVFTGSVEQAKAVSAVVSQTGFEKRVICLSDLSRDEFLATVASCDAGMLLYRNDGVGNYNQCPGRLTEYIGCGIGYIASDFPSLREPTLDDNLGVLCNPESSASIAEAVEKYCSRSEREITADRARLRELFVKKHSFEGQAWKLEEILKTV
jgi:hypothetical protein